MLIYSEERLVPTDINMMVIRGLDEVGYYYVHRVLYDQAVIIHDIYKDDIEMLIQSLTDKTDSRGDVDYFMSHTPSPISSLGPFLLLVKTELTEFRDMIGAIHVMSGPINLRNMLRVPFSMRNTPTFSLSIKEEYELAWDRFFKTTMSYDTWRNGGVSVVTQPQVQSAPIVAIQSVSVDEVPDEISEGASVEEIDDFLLAAMMDTSWLDDDDEEEVEESAPAPAPVPIPEPEPEPEPEQEAAPVVKKKSGLDILKGGL